MEKANIGFKAGIIFEKLGETGLITIAELARRLNFAADETALASGWLAREDKIQFELEHHSTKDKNVFLYLMLNVDFKSLFKNIAPGGVFAGGFLHLHI